MPAPIHARPSAARAFTGSLSLMLGTVLTVLMAGTAQQAAAQVAERQGGTTVIIGSGTRDDNHAVWQALVDAAGGPGARVAVFTASSSRPDAAAASILAALQAHGAQGEHIRIGPLIPGADTLAAAQDPAWAARVQAAQAVFFSGGRQDRLLDLLLPAGQPSAVLAAVREVWRRGGVVAGESAGAAVMSEIAFRELPSPLLALKGQMAQGQAVGPGFGFVPSGVMVDQHFLARGRIGRLLPLMVRSGQPLGLGVEEHSAAVVQGHQLRVVGPSGVVVVDLAHARQDPAQPLFNVQGVRLSYLQGGDSFDLLSRSALPAALRMAGPLKPQRLANGTPGAHAAVYPDILAPGLLLHAMAQLVDSDQPEALGLAFDAKPRGDDPDPTLGFEWRLSVDALTRAWVDPLSRYTIAGMVLDVRPVRMAQPIYRALSP